VNCNLTRRLSYAELAAKVGEQDTFDRVSEKGESYRVEIDFVVDDAKTQAVRVMSMISYSAWTDFSPVCGDFIMDTEGDFVGE